MEPPIDPPCEKPLYCPECLEDAYADDLACEICKKSFHLRELDYLDFNYEDERSCYGY